MRYLGGKSKLAKRLAAPILAERRGREIWEPFCGGLGMSGAWGGGPLLLTDVCAPLIAMYRALANGWNPPSVVSPGEYTSVQELADTDPLKGFLGFGCSFGGKWLAGYARGGTNADGSPRNHASESRRRVLRDVAAVAGATFECVDFLAIEPFAHDGIIYADPPYQGTTAYAGAPAFDSDAFVARVEGWASAGVVVFVSEFAFPIGKCVLELPRRSSISREGGDAFVERLYRAGP